MLKKGLDFTYGTNHAKHRGAIAADPRSPKSAHQDGTEPPHYLTDDIAVEEWKRVASHLLADGLLTAARRALLVGYCTAVARAIRAEETLLREGRYYETETNRGSVMRRRHPAAQDSEQAWCAVRKFARQLGLATQSPDDLGAGGGRRAIFK
ncbi:MAG: P27 family phage terminase small subunit [Defluviicoccus sp.]|nr:P27 family phage terminase small subunit [Defluviicoccus sp.]MDS4072648.1 P27 family phage terminase small subunit [Defluviicoccus sp.]